MEEIPQYNLIQAIDPTKVKVPISDRFAKLTLSSNKKQQAKNDDVPVVATEKRQNISRNLLHSLSLVDENPRKSQEEKSSSNESGGGKNPLLRSESSKETDNNNTLTGVDEYETMDPLNVTDDDPHTQIQLDEDLEALSQRIASMAVVTRPISISSDSTDHLSEITQLVSTESQQSSNGNEANKLYIVRNIPIKMSEALGKDNALLQSSDSSHKISPDQPYEMTDDETDEEKTEEGTEEEEEDVITISDTSESNRQDDPNEMITSLPSSTTQTSESLELPCMKDDKAERVAAFLRDVSIERRVMQECGEFKLNDTIDQILDNEAIDKIQETFAKSRQIASADTESMSADVDEEITPKSLTEREQRLKALGDLSKTNEEDDAFLKKSNGPNQIHSNSNNACPINRLANAKTQDNTVISDDEDLIEFDKTPKNQPSKINKNIEHKLNSQFSSLDLNKTPNIHSQLKTPTRYNSPKRYINNENDPHRLAGDDTEINSELPQTETNNNTKNHSNNQTPQRYNSPRRLANDETEINTESNKNSTNLPENAEHDQHRLANDDTVANSIMCEEYSEINKLSSTSMVYDYSRDLKTPDRHVHRFANDETKDNSPQSVPNTPEPLSESINSQPSHCSTVNSSPKNSSPKPEDSITILETDDEEHEERNIPSPHSISETDDEENGDQKKLSSGCSNTDDNKKLSNSFHNDDTSSSSDDDGGQMSRIQMSMAKINISAKINIKIHIPQTTSTDTSQDEQSHEDEREQEERNSVEEESNQQSNQQSNEEVIKPCNQLQSKPATGLTSLEKSLSDSIEEVEEDKVFLTEAEKLLTQLYGKSWQTPDVIRTLKHSRHSGDTKSNTSQTTASKKKETKSKCKGETKANKEYAVEESILDETKSKCKGETKANKEYAVEESILDDFSMFRSNIVRTNLDSTRLGTPKANPRQRLMKIKEISTEPRQLKKPSTTKDQEQVKPQTERKKAREPIAKIVTNRGRVRNDKWRQLIDNDSDEEGNNASDDDDADQSWSGNALQLESESDDSDFEIMPKRKPRNKKNNTTIKGPGGRNGTDNLTKQLNKSKEGDIVYLDLSKEEVSVQEGITDSPPANHDETFASRLQDILKTCRHEDKPKLPSSTTKTKRKLFTPIFGDDLEGGLPKEDTQQKANDAELIHDDIVEDSVNCPFDIQGRPKVLDVVNKQLEAVRTGKPIFQLTPSPKKQTTPLSAKNDKNMESATTPKTKKADKAVFKTPLTAKSKEPAKTVQELCQTLQYKYSFLKSLDVTVSKSLCHPDALIYRDNYRTKKEDLSKILYQMYNEQLFYNKIDVPITWNKKLSNTAGRCLNKKKLGIRTSVIELSDKVLTSADRLRCTLIHELCHAATWICNGEGGHGSTWKEWARKANATFPELPKIGVCHQYDIEYKYTYKCTLCAAKSHAHSKSKKVENIRCSYCHGAIEIFLNKKDKDGNILPTPVREPTGFAKFVKDNYKKFKRDDLKHADVMKILSGEFATLKLTTN